jgi:hypothetical protein
MRELILGHQKTTTSSFRLRTPEITRDALRVTRGCLAKVDYPEWLLDIPAMAVKL